MVTDFGAVTVEENQAVARRFVPAALSQAEKLVRLSMNESNTLQQTLRPDLFMPSTVGVCVTTPTVSKSATARGTRLAIMTPMTHAAGYRVD